MGNYNFEIKITKYFWEFFEGVTFFLFFVDDGSQWQRRSWSDRLLLSCETLLFNCVFRWQNWLQWQRDSLQLCWWSLPSIDDKITDTNLWAAQTLKHEEIRKHDIQDGHKHGRQDRRIRSHVSWGCMWRTLMWNFKKMHPDINHQLFLTQTCQNLLWYCQRSQPADPNKHAIWETTRHKHLKHYHKYFFIHIYSGGGPGRC